MSDKSTEREEREGNYRHQDACSPKPFVSYTGTSENIPNLKADYPSIFICSVETI